MEDKRLSLAIRVVSFFPSVLGEEPGALSVNLFSTNLYFIHEELRLGKCSFLTEIRWRESHQQGVRSWAQSGEDGVGTQGDG